MPSPRPTSSSSSSKFPALGSLFTNARGRRRSETPSEKWEDALQPPPPAGGKEEDEEEEDELEGGVSDDLEETEGEEEEEEGAGPGGQRGSGGRCRSI